MSVLLRPRSCQARQLGTPSSAKIGRVRELILLALVGCGRIGFDAVGGDQPPDRQVLFFEPFEDASFASREWYDGPDGLITTTEHAPGSTSSFRCDWSTGAQRCAQGSPRRRLFSAVEKLYVSYWIKNDPTLDRHLGLVSVMTDTDDPAVGPNDSHLTAAMGEDQGVLRYDLTDTRNVDPNCVKLTDSTVVGCAGNFDGYAFTEARSVCACNGLVGDVQGWQCDAAGGNVYLSRRSWQSTGAPFGAPYDTAWHLVEIELRMNTIAGGIGQPDGVFRYWLDGALVLSSERALFRTGAHPAMAWNQILFEPFLENPATRSQVLWLDDLTVARIL